MVEATVTNSLIQALEKENAELRSRCHNLEDENYRLRLKIEMSQPGDVTSETRSLLSMIHRYQIETMKAFE